jgi:hypothetical protein
MSVWNSDIFGPFSSSKNTIPAAMVDDLSIIQSKRELKYSDKNTIPSMYNYIY